jgi:phage terminase small subunit
MIHELLKDAYNNEDWDLVAQAYKELTGKKISNKKEKVVPKKRGRPKKVSIIVPTNEDIELVKEKPSKVFTGEVKEDFTLISKPVGKQEGDKYGRLTLDYLKVPNKFKDDGKLEKDSAIFDKKVRNKKNSKPVERREAPQFIKVNCKDCKKPFKVLEGDLKEGDEGEVYFRCDSCWINKNVRND